MDNLSEYKDFWGEIRSKIERMRTLSSVWKEDEYAIRSFAFPIEPVVPKTIVNEFEVKNKIEMPLSYKSYLLHFGGAGPCDSGHTLDFVKHVSNVDVSTPSKLKIIKNPIDIDSENGEFHPIQSGNGTVEIASIASPATPYLVLNGNASGYVYWWNHGDMVGSFGEFSDWYKQWADKSLAFVEREYAVFTTPIGISQKELWEMYPEELKHEDHEGIEYVYHKNSRAAFVFDSKGCLKSIHKRHQYLRELKKKDEGGI